MPATEHHSPLEVAIDRNVRGLRIAVAAVDDIQIGPSSDDLRQWCRDRVASVVQRGMSGGDERREAVRAMIRAGGFKPSGRNKPAQEYLLRTVHETQTLPEILNAVDVLNAISLDSGLPISLLARERLGSSPLIRYGISGERFVFNRSAQELEIAGLLCVCRNEGSSSVPLGTPIKDSMAGKVADDDRAVAAILYAPANLVSQEEVDGWASQLGSALRQFCSRGA